MDILRRSLVNAMKCLYSRQLLLVHTNIGQPVQDLKDFTVSSVVRPVSTAYRYMMVQLPFSRKKQVKKVIILRKIWLTRRLIIYVSKNPSFRTSLSLFISHQAP